MAAASELRKILSRRLVPLLADIEDLVFRYGYIRVFASAVAMLGTVGLLSQVLGIAWLRTTFATATAVLFVIAALVSFASVQKLQSRLRVTEDVLHTYIEELPRTAPISIRKWRQEIVIENSGDTWSRREVTMAESTGRHLRYLTFATVYYGSTKLTERDKKRIEHNVQHASSTSPENGIRVPTTSTWTESSDGKPKLTVYAHLGRAVEEGDVVTTEWYWPKYSTDFMKGRQPESFDTLFLTTVTHFEQKVVFRNLKDHAALKIKTRSALEVERYREGRDTIIRFAGQEPAIGKRLGFVADLNAGG